MRSCIFNPIDWIRGLFGRRKKIKCERYAKRLYFADGDRTTVYAHAECLDAWQKAASDEGGIVYACGENERPVAAKTKGGES